MNYDGLVLAAVVAELGRTIEGGQIQGIRQHNDTDFTLEIRSKGKSHLLFMSVSPRFARVYLTATNLPVPKTAPNFCMLMRKYIKGSFITAVEQVDFDRILRIRIEAPDGNRNVLVLELMGKHSNMILLSDAERILGAAKNVTAAVSRYRQVFPGRDYIPPPGGKISPIEVTREQFDATWRDGLGEEILMGSDLKSLPNGEDLVKHWLVAAFSGIGPFLAMEILRSAKGIDSESIWVALQELRGVVTAQDYSPRLITDDRGSGVLAYPIETHQHPPTNQHERWSMTETLDTLFRDLVRRSDFDTERAPLELAIRRSIAARQQTLRQLEDSIAEGGKAERYKEFGELILASVAGITKGEKIARVIDYYNPEMAEVEIPLDETLTPKENAERYFRRFRKAREGAEAAKDRIKEIRIETKILETSQERLPAATTVESLKGLRGMLTDRGLLRSEPRPTAPGKRPEPEFGGARIRRATSVDGIEILYGENSQSNDYLTTKVARPNDYWLHARSVTGAHVVIRTGNRPESIPHSTIRDAARIAAQNSEAKHSSLVPVDYTLRKHVRKPRAAAAGSVTYGHEKTIDVTPD